MIKRLKHLHEEVKIVLEKSDLLFILTINKNKCKILYSVKIISMNVLLKFILLLNLFLYIY